MAEGRSRVTPLILLVDDQEWTSRSIESILRPKGHAVVKAYTGRQALDLVGKVSPDAIIVDFHLPDLDGVDVARELRASPTVSPSTPILMITTSNVNRAARLEALGAGVWDILRHPVDPSELVLRIGTFIEAKQNADRIKEEGLTDPLTGFYNARGLLRRTREISAEARRLERSVACLALGGDLFDDVRRDRSEEGGSLGAEEIELIEALRVITRVSDTVGRLPSGEFIVVAPGADEGGALRLIDRVNEFLDRAKNGGGHPAVERLANRLRAGYYAAQVEEPMAPEELLLRATMALRRAQSEDDTGPFSVRSYQA
ncbi:MAG: response regulator [Longimicrobiales bacterium]